MIVVCLKLHIIYFLKATMNYDARYSFYIFEVCPKYTMFITMARWKPKFITTVKQISFVRWVLQARWSHITINSFSFVESLFDYKSVIKIQCINDMKSINISITSVLLHFKQSKSLTSISSEIDKRPNNLWIWKYRPKHILNILIFILKNRWWSDL